QDPSVTGVQTCALPILELLHLLAVRLHPDALIVVEQDLLAIRPGDLQRQDLLLEEAGLRGRRGLDVRAVSEVVRVLAGDAPLRGDREMVVCGKGCGYVW